MGIKSLEKSLESLDAKIGALRAASAAIDRWRGDAAAALFHLRPKHQGPMIVAILGGTGTGKSTLVNRILEANLSAASFRRTFTAGPVALARIASDVPQNWLGLPHATVSPADLPARGQADSLLIVEAANDVLNRAVLVDTPDLDGDQPVHHAQADRAFRWAEGIIFLVSPEKYQMTELLPYYRLARRYALPAIFVMNKCETAEMLEDYRQLVSAEGAEETVYAVARDDAAYEPPVQGNLQFLRQAISTMNARRIRRACGARDRFARAIARSDHRPATKRAAGCGRRRLRPAAMEAPPPGVDVNPITEQLQRRLQQRSVLYLIGPGRVLDRVRQVPGILVRLPRTAWELVMHGKTELKSVLGTDGNSASRQAPDFNAALTDQFAIIQAGSTIVSVRRRPDRNG